MVRADHRHQLNVRVGQVDRVLTVLGEAARHHARRRPNGIDVPTGSACYGRDRLSRPRLTRRKASRPSWASSIRRSTRSGSPSAHRCSIVVGSRTAATPSGSGYKPWDGTPNPNVPSGHPTRSIDGMYYGLRRVLAALRCPTRARRRRHRRGTRSPRWRVPARRLHVRRTTYVVNIGGTWWVNDGQNGTNGRTNWSSAWTARAARADDYALAIEEAQHELDRSTVAATSRTSSSSSSDGAANTIAAEPARRPLGADEPSDGSAATVRSGRRVGAAHQGRRARSSTRSATTWTAHGHATTSSVCGRSANGHYNSSNPVRDRVQRLGYNPVDGCDATTRSRRWRRRRALLQPARTGPVERRSSRRSRSTCRVRAAG